MATRDDRRAGVVLLSLAATGLVLRLILGGGSAPGAVLYRATNTNRPSHDSVAARSARLARPVVKGEKIDVDRVAAGELVRLPRIGPTLAARIVADRDSRGPFGTLAQLDRVTGVGPALLAMIEPYVVFSGRPRPRNRSIEDPVRVRLNSATAEDLAQLPGIGATRARAIVEDRAVRGPYRSVEDLTRVKGIGMTTMERLRKLVIVP